MARLNSVVNTCAIPSGPSAMSCSIEGMDCGGVARAVEAGLFGAGLYEHNPGRRTARMPDRPNPESPDFRLLNRAMAPISAEFDSDLRGWK
jgi:hypothetical protein